MAEGEAGQGGGEELLKLTGERALWDGGRVGSGDGNGPGMQCLTEGLLLLHFLSKQRSKGYPLAVCWHVGATVLCKEFREPGDFQGPKSQ